MDLSYLDKIALSSYTSLERQSIYQMLCGTMMCDGYRDAREVGKIEEIVNLIGLSDSERQNSRELNSNTMISTLRAMDELKKAYLAKFVCQIVLADGIVNDKEKAFINYYFNLLEIPQI